MKAQLTIVGGQATRSVHVFSGPEVSLGRHPECHVQFDPQTELEVSSRHALLFQEGSKWMLRDLGSRNGTLVNGHAIRGAIRLDDTDHIQLGPNGPKLEFRLVGDHTADTLVPKPLTGPQRVTASEPKLAEAARPPEGVTARVRTRVARETRKLRAIVAALTLAIVAVVLVAIAVTLRRDRERDSTLAELRNQIDTVLARHAAVVAQLEGQVEGLADALERSQRELRDLRSALGEAERRGDQSEIASLRRQLATAMTTIAQQTTAVQIDYVRIRDENQNAVAMVWVERETGEVVSGSGFAVGPDGTVITNRHVVSGETGKEAIRRIAVQFADSEQAFSADVVAVSQDAAVDLAVLRVRLRGQVPTVRSLNRRSDTLAVGSPVAILGFPYGTDLPMRPGRVNPVASTSLTVGVVSRLLPDRIQILGFGAEGASGSPVFDANGEVVGVLFGGEVESDNRIVYAVPATRVAALLAGIR
jgi:S1-C subfamily serine protease